MKYTKENKELKIIGDCCVLHWGRRYTIVGDREKIGGATERFKPLVATRMPAGWSVTIDSEYDIADFISVD